LTGNQTFQSASVKYDVSLLPGTGGFSNTVLQNFGTGAVLAYDAAADSFTVTPTGGAPVTFTQANLIPSQSAPGREVFEKINGNITERIFLISPNSGAVPLSYLSFVIYNKSVAASGNTNASFSAEVSVGGVPTVQRDMPTTGTASYTFGVGGTAVKAGTSHTLEGNSTATFSANFGAGTVATTINVMGRSGAPTAPGPLVSFGTATGDGNIVSGGPAFNGAFRGTGDVISGQFSGAFFGPQGLEAGYEFFLLGNDFSAVGSGAGSKGP
jgi:hypothetical protein